MIEQSYETPWLKVLFMSKLSWIRMLQTNNLCHVNHVVRIIYDSITTLI